MVKVGFAIVPEPATGACALVVAGAVGTSAAMAARSRGGVALVDLDVAPAALKAWFTLARE